MITWFLEAGLMTWVIKVTRGQAWALIICGIVIMLELMAGSSLLAIILTH